MTFVCAAPPPRPEPAGVQRLAMLDSRQWRDRRTLHVRFLEGDPRIHKYIADLITGPRGWNPCSAMQFVFDNDPKAEIRIAFQEGASWSQLGTDALWSMDSHATMNLNVRIEDAGPHIDRPINHEFGHALGLIHEQKSPLAGEPNVEAIYAFYMERGWTREQTDAQVLRKEDPMDVQAVALDRRSVMAYVQPGSLWQDGQSWESSPYPTYWDAYAAELFYGPPPWYYTSVILPFVARS